MFISEPSKSHLTVMSSEDHTHLFPRKGGGAGSAGGGHGGGKGGSKGGKSGSAGASRAADVAKAHGASETFLKSRSVTTFGIPGTKKTSATAYADGGGKHITLGSDSPFSGREAGGGSRNTIYGTSHFGSGYPYGGYGSFVNSRPFPYYFYPVPVSHNYYGGDEYLNVNDTKRPGGNLIYAIVQPSNSLNSVTYRLVGDNSSVTAVFDALVANCSVANSTSAIAPFYPSSNTWPLPEQIVQYYRASSFALSLDNYNNTATLLANAPTSNSSSMNQIPDTPIPSGLNLTFLECVNTTVGVSVPLVDFNGVNSAAVGKSIGIALGSALGFFVLLLILGHCCCERKGERRYR